MALGDPKSQANALGLIGAPLRALSRAGKRAIWPRGCYVPGADLPFLIIFPRLPACALPAPSHSSVGMNHLRVLALLFPSSTGRPSNKEPQKERSKGVGGRSHRAACLTLRTPQPAREFLGHSGSPRALFRDPELSVMLLGEAGGSAPGWWVGD